MMEIKLVVTKKNEYEYQDRSNLIAVIEDVGL